MLLTTTGRVRTTFGMIKKRRELGRDLIVRSPVWWRPDNTNRHRLCSPRNIGDSVSTGGLPNFFHWGVLFVFSPIRKIVIVLFFITPTNLAMKMFDTSQVILTDHTHARKRRII